MAEDVKSFGDLKSTLIKAKPAAPAGQPAEQIAHKRDAKGRGLRDRPAQGRGRARLDQAPGLGRIIIKRPR